MDRPRATRGLLRSAGVLFMAAGLTLVAWTAGDSRPPPDPGGFGSSADTTSGGRGAPRLQFEVASHDFGEIEQTETVEHVFSFTNAGDAPLKITDVESS